MQKEAKREQKEEVNYKPINHRSTDHRRRLCTYIDFIRHALNGALLT